MSIGKRISNLRKQYSYSQEYVADKVNVSRQAVSKWERDQAAPDTYNLIALAELFNVTVEYLAIGNTGPKSGDVRLKDSYTDRISTQKLIGLVLLGVGLIGMILGLLFAEELMVMAALLLVASVLCLTVRKNLGLVMAWTYIAIVFLASSVLTANNLFAVFNPMLYIYGSLDTGLIVSYMFWGVTLLIAIITVFRLVKVIKSKR